MKPLSRLPKAVILLIVMTNSLGIGLVLPVMPDLLRQVGEVEIAQAAAIGGLLSLAFAAMQVLFGPTLGALSDQFGRRPVLIVSLLMSALDYLILAVANALWMFFVIRLFAGIASATFSVSNAVLADTSKPEDRAAQFGLTGAAFGLGFVLGPLFGGLLGELGPRAPFVAAAGLCTLAAILAYAVLPETRSKSATPFQWANCIPFVAFAKLRQRLSMVPLLAVQFLDATAGFVYPAVWAYFAVVQFGWGPTMIGVSLAGYGACMAVIQAGGVRLLVNRFGEERTATYGLMAGVLGFVVIGSVEAGWLAIALTPLLVARAVSGTAVSGLLSRQASDAAQGELQGLLSATTGLATMVSIPMMTQIFAFANSEANGTSWPGAPFAVSAVFSIFALLLLRRSIGAQKRDS